MLELEWCEHTAFQGDLILIQFSVSSHLHCNYYYIIIRAFWQLATTTLMHEYNNHIQGTLCGDFLIIKIFWEQILYMHWPSTLHVCTSVSILYLGVCIQKLYLHEELNAVTLYWKRGVSWLALSTCSAFDCG